MEDLENIKWLGHASFFFIDENGNRIYYVDPFDLKGRSLEKADLIFLTHAHYDHFSPDDLSQILADQTTIIAPPDILQKIPNAGKLEVLQNKTYEVGGFKFSTIPEYNTHPDRLNPPTS